MEEGNILDLQERKDEERRKIREEKARLARHAAIQVGTGPGRRGLCDTILLASSGEAARGLSASPRPWHGAGSEPALEMERSLWRWRCHRAVSCCAPAKPWQLILSL